MDGRPAVETAQVAQAAGPRETSGTSGAPASFRVRGGGGDEGAAVAARRARFGRLPERVRFEDMVQEQVVPRDPARDAYDAAGSSLSYSCLALDLGL